MYGRALRRIGFVSVAVILGGMLNASCSSGEPAKRTVAASCTLNSDCDGTLVCTLGRCHAECKTTKDCPSPERCVVANDAQVCQLPAEKSCLETSCALPLFCATDDQCRNRCSSPADCLLYQVCAKQGFCAEPTEVDSSGNLKGVGDAGTPTGGAGAGGKTSGSGGRSGVDGGAESAGGTGGASSAGAGGTSSTGGARDAGQMTDASIRSTPEAGADAATGCTLDAQCAPPTPTCEQGACVADVVLLVAGAGDTSHQCVGASYDGSTWTTTSIGADVFPAGGGGVTVLPDGSGVALLRGNQTPRFLSARWSGSWTQLVAQGTFVENYVGPPLAASGKVFAAHQAGSALELAEYSGTTGVWFPLEDATGLLGDNHTIPSAIPVGSGDALVLFGESSTPTAYRSTLRTGGIWSAASSIPGPNPQSLGLATSEVRAARIGSSVLAVMRGGTGQSLAFSVWSGGAWSGASALTSAMSPSVSRPFALTALRDGRAALVFVDAASALNVAFFSGSWGAFATVPGVTVSQSQPVSIAHGAHGTAVLELAYVDASAHIGHTRLTNEAQWSWTVPVQVAAADTYTSVDIATGP